MSKMLEEAVRVFLEKNFHGGAKSNREDYSAMVPTADIFKLKQAYESSLSDCNTATVTCPRCSCSVKLNKKSNGARCKNCNAHVSILNLL